MNRNLNEVIVHLISLIILSHCTFIVYTLQMKPAAVYLFQWLLVVYWIMHVKTYSWRGKSAVYISFFCWNFLNAYFVNLYLFCGRYKYVSGTLNGNIIYGSHISQITLFDTLQRRYNLQLSYQSSNLCDTLQ